MPQLLHYLKVDDQTRLSTPLPGPATGAAVEEGEAVPAAVPEGGRAFFNQKDTVSAETACHLCVCVCARAVYCTEFRPQTGG
jgi:hypothetical protein